MAADLKIEMFCSVVRTMTTSTANASIKVCGATIRLVVVEQRLLESQMSCLSPDVFVSFPSSRLYGNPLVCSCVLSHTVSLLVDDMLDNATCTNGSAAFSLKTVVSQVGPCGE